MRDVHFWDDIHPDRGDARLEERARRAEFERIIAAWDVDPVAADKLRALLGTWGKP